MAQLLRGKKVALLLETEYIYDEVVYYKEQVAAQGGELHMLTYLWGQKSKTFINDCDSPDRPVTSLHALTVDRCVTQVDVNDYDIVLCAANYVAVRLREIPPMGNLGSPSEVNTAPAVKFFADAMLNPKIVKGALCHALWLLTPNPQLLKGRKVICHTVVLADIINAGATYVPAKNHVVVDTDLVTARSFADIEAYWQAILATVGNVAMECS
ncbi:MAG: DJ-1/PfpI family protein [Proteobacteria bacterium]|nr:DJ-1/PfpI family protein [Pseudomonadota bacterium]MBU1639394.1 DJ-1/PfpI family protein [Pseudomonadota bacterium]